MRTDVATFLLFLALVCFLLAAIDWPKPATRLIAAGLFLWLLSSMIKGGS